MEIRSRIQLGQLLKHMGIFAPVAEIGVAEGNFSRDILEQWDVPLLYMVDRWACNPDQKGDGGFPQEWHDQNHADALAKVQPHADSVRILRGDSAEMAKNVTDESLALVYIDCDHSYEGCMGDLKAWFPKVMKGGIIAGHDYLNPSYGVHHAVTEFCFQNGFEAILISETNRDDAGFYFVKKIDHDRTSSNISSNNYLQ